MIENQEENTEMSQERLPIEQWLAIRKEAALRIDPETAEVMWDHRYGVDPYCLYRDSEIPEEYKVVGREYFARAPGSDIWVWFGDLPEETEKKLWAMHSSKLAAFIITKDGWIWNTK